VFADRFRLVQTMTRLLLPLVGLAAGQVAAQERVVSKQISVGRDEASLALELTGGEALEVSFEDGSIQIDGESIGASSPELDAAWRALLGRVLALEGGPLVQALREWSPPEGLTDNALVLATRVDQALEEALDETVVTADVSGTEREERFLGELLSRGALGGLARALEGTALENVQVHVDEDFEVQQGAEIEGTLVVVDGDLTVRGDVDGDVVVVDGTLLLEEGGRIRGDVRLLDARIEREGGRLEGDLIELDASDEQSVDVETEARIREEVEREVRAELGDRDERSRMGGLFSPIGFVVRGVAGILGSIVTIIVLSLVGGVVMHLAGTNLEVAAETARRAPGRAAAVGLAGTFLALPVWLLGAIALAVSIIGIPIALIWLPLFPIALALAIVLGYYAVARNVGVWVSRQRYSQFSWVRPSNPYTLVGGGVLLLWAAFLVASVLELGGPLLGFLQALFVICGILVSVFAALVGFGAVLITRAGRRPEYYPSAEFFDASWDADWGMREPEPQTPPADGPAGPEEMR
jgi:hypothetical protein